MRNLLRENGFAPSKSLPAFYLDGVTPRAEQSVIQKINGIGGVYRAVLVEVHGLIEGITARTKQGVIEEIDRIRTGYGIGFIQVTGGIGRSFVATVVAD